ncbi:MAG TPA: desaturase, partial [Myxococcales bacterium]|nr:desaturase [Myxococcales bacterium]
MPAPIAKPVAKRLYDVAVLGPDVGGAAAAALCARRGLRTLLAPLSPVTAARESEGWLLPGA